MEESKQKLEMYNRELETMLDDLQNTQAQLVEAEKMASLGGLVAGIAHEINTPLGISVTSATTMHQELVALQKKFESDSLKRSELEGFFEQSNQVCDILHQNLIRASELVRSFKQVAVDQTLDEWRDIDFREYCDEVLTSIGPQFRHRPISVENNCAEDITLRTHPGAIYQILSNLVLNSITHGYAADDSGIIRISAEREGDMLAIDYRDDGKGIDESNIKRIFDPFFTTRRGQGGSGLGLSIVYNIVTGTLKGSISVDSKPGQGVHFEILLPLPSA
jgi:signal transduction histidine kinase